MTQQNRNDTDLNDSQIKSLKASHISNMCAIEHIYNDYLKLKAVDKRLRRRSIALQMLEEYRIVKGLEQDFPFLTKFNPPPEIQEMLDEAARPPQPGLFRPERTFFDNANVAMLRPNK